MHVPADRLLDIKMAADHVQEGIGLFQDDEIGLHVELCDIVVQDNHDRPVFGGVQVHTEPIQLRGRKSARPVKLGLGTVENDDAMTISVYNMIDLACGRCVFPAENLKECGRLS